MRVRGRVRVRARGQPLLHGVAQQPLGVEHEALHHVDH